MIKKIVIHTCCADCLIHLIAALQEENQITETTEIVLFFYNPNIHPRSEYLERLNAVKRVLKEKYPNKNIKLVIPEYRPKEYFENISGKKKRCLGCWEIRLRKTFEYAKKENIKYASSTLLSSNYQDTDTIETIGKQIETEGIKLILPISKHEHINNKGFYKQNFCGCCFSLTERLIEKYVNHE